MIISIGGKHGSGKDALAKRLSETLNWPVYSMGGLRRQKATERGLTLAEYNKLGEEDPNTDLEVDKYQTTLGKERDNFIIIGRTSWHFIPHSFKIYLDVTELIGAQRILADLAKNPQRQQEDVNLNSLENIITSNQHRYQSDAYRYQKYFQIDVHDLNNYDYIVDTNQMTEEEVYQKVIKKIKEQINTDNKVIDKR